MRKKYPVVLQYDTVDCAPACLKMIAQYYGKSYPLEYIREQSFITKEGVSLLSISQSAEKIGFNTLMSVASIDVLENECPLPAILHWKQEHFIVLYKIKNNKYIIADPAQGLVSISKSMFINFWISTSDAKGVALFLEPQESFYHAIPPKDNSFSVKDIFKYLLPYKRSVVIMCILLFLGSIISILFPFLTQNIIDKGIASKKLSIITLLLLAQLVAFIGSITIEIFRNRLLLFVSTKISITIIADFLKKLLQLPIKFFESKMMGDFNQRIQDNERIEVFLTSQSLSTFFSTITLLVFVGVLGYYNIGIAIVYILLTSFALLWSLYWLRKRKALDYLRFQQQSENQESIYEIINGIPEMKLNQFEEFMRKEWENIQQKMLKTNIRILKIDQWQLSGYDFINQVKNIFIYFLAAVLVVKNSMTLGELLAISYITGQLNSPIYQLINFFRSLQDAKLSFERLNEVQNISDEEQPEIQHPLSSQGNIIIKNLSFQYEGPQSPRVLENINFTIPKGRITAIVGASGSGKTTLMKLLLKFYEPTSGNIFIGEADLKTISPKSLRKNCGVVMQDGFIFADSIERNIATSDEEINNDKLKNAVNTANIAEYINELPLKFKTKIGASGNGISGGQKQRILIARAVYKNPHYIFFDEATSALDAENEKIIHENLKTFFKGKTVLIIAHRLSTVKNADQIIVLDKGEVAEIGSHEMLTKAKGKYYELVRNQLELGE